MFRSEEYLCTSHHNSISDRREGEGVACSRTETSALNPLSMCFLSFAGRTANPSADRDVDANSNNEMTTAISTHVEYASEIEKFNVIVRHSERLQVFFYYLIIF